MDKYKKMRRQHTQPNVSTEQDEQTNSMFSLLDIVNANFDLIYQDGKVALIPNTGLKVDFIDNEGDLLTLTLIDIMFAPDKIVISCDTFEVYT